MRRMHRASGLVLVAALAAACSGPPPPPFKPAADLKQLMANVVEPAADEYWDAVGWIDDAQGTIEIQPETQEEWDAVRHHAYAIAESGNLMMLPTRAKDADEWMRLSVALVEAGQRAIQAAEQKNKQAVFDTGAEIYDACTNCHAKYAVELQRPNAAK
jgi:hypothetical protein